MKDLRKDGEPFTCKNNKYQTVTNALPSPIYVAKNKCQLRLEHVVNVNDPTDKCLWFMWYYADGNPMLAESAVFDWKDLSEIIKNIPHLTVPN